MSIRSKQDLELELSKLKSFENPSMELEQYATPASIAAEWIWLMALRGEVAGKIFFEGERGAGILGIGLLFMGAKKVYFVDKDESAMKLCMKNYQTVADEYEVGEAEFVVQDIRLFDENVDVVVQNPPFGTKNAHVDKVFLEKAFSVAPVVYSMHKFSTKQFVEAISPDFGFEITHVWRYDFPIKAQFAFHQKRVETVDVGLWRMKKISEA